MADVKVTEVRELGNDVLLVEGAVDGVDVRAQGWVSATTNHFDADAYGADGHRKPDATPRKMTAKERREYCARLLVEALA